jgi:hypothetical protein
VIESIGADGKTEVLTTDAKQALERAEAAIDQCIDSGIDWGNETLQLDPSPQLEDLIRKSLAVGVGE